MEKPILLDFRDTQAVERLFNEAFQHPRRSYIIQPTERIVALAWLKKYAWMRNFTQGTKASPLRRGELIHLDTLYYRERCGWNAGYYHCDYPPTENPDVELCSEHGCEECSGGDDGGGGEGQKGLCLSGCCPIASPADREDIRKLDPDLYRSDYQPYPDEEPRNWMVLRSRPRYAFVPNVTVLGCECEEV